MKWMKFTASLLAGLMFLAACSEADDQDYGTPDEGEMVTYTLGGEVERISRVAYSDQDNEMACVWEIGDQVHIAGTAADPRQFRFDVTEVDADGSATLTYYGTMIHDAETFQGTATYTVPAQGEIVQQQNGTADTHGIRGDGAATAHLKYGTVLTAEVNGLTDHPTLTFVHPETSAYRILLAAPQDFAPGEAQLSMAVGKTTNTIRLGFGVKKGQTVVAYMLGREATVPVGGALEFTLSLPDYDYVYNIPLKLENPLTYGTGKYWLADLRPFQPAAYRQMRLEDMTLEEKVAQLFIVHPERLSGTTVATSMDATMKSNLKDYAVGGVILFGQNIKNPTQTKAFISDIKKNSKYLPFIAVDEEGGRVARVGGNSNFSVEKIPNMLEIGSTGDVTKAQHAGDVIGAYLSELGFNLDFAPVADVFSNPKNTVIGDRSFSSNAYVVAPMVSAYIDGLHQHGILSTLKHFPGHGDTSTDSHTSLPLVTKTWAQLLTCEIVPFRYNKDKTDLIMTAHIAVSTVNEKLNGNTLPSTLSANMINGKLRGELGYQGLITTDALQMDGIAKFYTQNDAAIQAIQAGCDIILCPSTFLGTSGTYQAVLKAVKSGKISESRINESVARIIAKKRRMLQ